MSETVIHYDVIIIGSGAGGGTVAKELSFLVKSGLRVALLEWGGRFEPQDFERTEITMAERLYFDRGGFLTRSGDMILAFAKAVGGSTTVYTGTSLTLPQYVVDGWNVPGITTEDLSPRFEKYVRENNIHQLEPHEINDNNRLFYEGCKKLGWAVHQFPVNVKGCQGLGTCNLGCASGAKQGTNRVQIPIAEQNGVHVIPNCRVDRIEDHDVLAEVIAPRWGLPPSDLRIGRYRFRADKIVIAAGAVHSPAILLRSLGRKCHRALGRYFTCHPALILCAEHSQPITNVTGHPKSFYCSQFSESRRFLLETCMYFPFTLAKSLAGFGTDADAVLGNYPTLQMILVLAMDDALYANRVSVDQEGNPRVHYRFNRRCVDALVDGIRASTHLFFASGAKRVSAPAMRRFFIHPEQVKDIDSLIHRRHFKLGKISITAAHLMGGCRMGEHPEESVTDNWGKIHGFDHLYVADASLFPAAAQINPHLTIMALADRVAEGVQRDLGSKQ